jgi:outer membrane protein TolC
LVELVETKQSMGVGARQDLPLAKANLFRARGNLRRVNSSYQEILRSLEVILGRYPSAELKAAPDFVAVPPPIPIGLPSEILERRPDMVAAENRVRAAFFGAREARAARLPSVSLSASAGADSALSDMLGAGNLATNLGASMFAPLYSGGALKAGVEIADAQQRAALAGYAQAALRAFQEVETALTNEQLLREQEGFLQEVVTESNEAYRITRTQYDSGEVDLLTVLQTQAGLLGSRSSLIAIRNERLAQRVDLHLALGGSFEPAGE